MTRVKAVFPRHFEDNSERDVNDEKSDSRVTKSKMRDRLLLPRCAKTLGIMLDGSVWYP